MVGGRPHDGIWSRLGLLILGLVGGLLLMEAGLRLAGPAWRPPWAERATFWRHDTLFGWSQAPGKRGVFSGPGFRVPVEINSRGLRGREWTEERSPGGPTRILLLGDSFGWGYGVVADSILAVRLEREESVEVVNGSVSGYDSGQQLLWYRREGRRYRSDLILLLVSDNDVADNGGRSVYWYRKPFFALAGDTLALHGVPVPRQTWTERVRIWVLGRTYLGAALRRLWWNRPRLAAAPDTPPISAPDAAARPDSSAFRLTRAILRALASEARADGASLALAVGTMPGPLAAWWVAEARAQDLPVFDLNGRIDRAHALWPPHDLHWNARGHGEAAAALAPWLDSLHAERKPPRRSASLGSSR